MIYWLDLAGVFVFALTGALAADRRGMDLFGFLFIALLPAVGGGTMRDVIIGTPVFWVADSLNLWIVAIAAALTFLAAPMIHRAERLLIWADAVGLAVFCAVGAAKTLTITGNPVVAVAMGVVTAVLGGIIRDVVCNEIPLVLRQDIYATAAFAGSLVYVLLAVNAVDQGVALAAGMLVCFFVRGTALVWGWSLPRRGEP
jgi:uncharacterized membrane protein YeiH